MQEYINMISMTVRDMIAVLFIVGFQVTGFALIYLISYVNKPKE